MKKLFLLMVLIAASGFVNAQERGIARGAVTGELYMSGCWYGIYNQDWGPPVFDTLVKAFYHITDHGKKITFPYCADAFAHDDQYPYYDTTITVPWVVIADATPGVLYNRDSHRSHDLTEWIQSLWVSFDYGKTWELREEDHLKRFFFTGSFEGMVYKGQSLGYEKSFFRSFDYGLNYEELPVPIKGLEEQGLDSCEFWNADGIYPWTVHIIHTMDCGQTYDYMPIDSQYFFCTIMYGIAPDVYRGALPGEVYVSSWFPDWTYKISFSADTGHTFRVVYHSDSLYFWGDDDKSLRFMSGREAGVFYIVAGELVEMDNPWGYYAKICISHYADYGETLVGTYCHDLKINYLESCAGVLDMEAEVVDKNNVFLQWNVPETETLPTAYRVYRNDTLLIELPQTSYLDEDLPNGSYTYHVRAFYDADSCVSLSYNMVEVVIENTGGIVETHCNASLLVYPNPTSGEFKVSGFGFNVTGIAVFDLMGKSVATVETRLIASLQESPLCLDISPLPSGMYFVRITTENGVVTKKVVKR